MDDAWRLWGFFDSLDVLHIGILVLCALVWWADQGGQHDTQEGD